MTREEFDNIYDEIVYPFIQEVVENNSLIDLKNQDMCKQQIYSEYERLNRQYKTNVFNRVDGELLDRHKVAACVCGAFLKVSVIDKTRLVKQIQADGRKVESWFFYVNELVAYIAAIRVLALFMIHDYEADENKQICIMNEFPRMPDATHSKVGVLNSILFDLAQIKDETQIGIDHYDMYAYALIFFMQEIQFRTYLEERT